MSEARAVPFSTKAPNLGLRAVLAFAAVYVIWGSTYLAIRFAIETLPVFTMAGTRFVIAGSVMLAWAWLRGARWPSLANWKAAALMGFLLLACGNGSVAWAEHRVASGLAALLIATEPLFVCLVLWAWPGGERPRARTVGALLIGFGGTALLALGGGEAGAGALHLPSVLALLFACCTWAVGSVYGRDARLPESPYQSIGLQMLFGGVMLLAFGLLTGEASRIDPQAFSGKSLLALGYLVVFGSLIAFSAYSWLLRNARPTHVATYAYVNPVVAMLLGAVLAAEPIGATAVAASLLILTAVVLVSTDRGHRRRPAEVREIEGAAAPCRELDASGERRCA